MSTDKDDLSIEDDFVAVEDDAEPPVESAKPTSANAAPSTTCSKNGACRNNLPISITTCSPTLAKPPARRLHGLCSAQALPLRQLDQVYQRPCIELE